MARREEGHGGLARSGRLRGDKKHARAFWRSLTAPEDTTGAPTALEAGGPASISTAASGRRSTPRSRRSARPEAWAGGYDGTGTTVAVLDTGSTPTHPDLRASSSARRTSAPTRRSPDGNGHGTHVAATIAGTGAASPGEGRRRPGRRAARRQGARRRRLRRGLRRSWPAWSGPRPGRGRRQHEPRRRRQRRQRPAQPGGRRAHRRHRTRSSSSRPATAAGTRARSRRPGAPPPR